MIETPNADLPSVTDSSRISEQALESLIADPNNARLHTDRNLDTIQASLQEVGAARSIVIDENGVILAGNATAQAAQQAGMTRVQIVEADGDAIIAVRRRNLTPEQKTRLALFDNRANDLSTFDPLMLAGLQAEGISLEGLWSGDELDTLLADLPSMEELTTDTPVLDPLPEPSTAYKEMITGAADRGKEIDRQEREISPRPPSADTKPYQSSVDPPKTPEEAVAPVPGLDRVTPNQDTSRAGLFLHFRSLKIPLSLEEGALLDERLAAHREHTGTYYGFIDSLLGTEKQDQEKQDQEEEEEEKETDGK